MPSSFSCLCLAPELRWEKQFGSKLGFNLFSLINSTITSTTNSLRRRWLPLLLHTMIIMMMNKISQPTSIKNNNQFKKSTGRTEIMMDYLLQLQNCLWKNVDTTKNFRTNICSKLGYNEQRIISSFRRCASSENELWIFFSKLSSESGLGLLWNSYTP